MPKKTDPAPPAGDGAPSPDADAPTTHEGGAATSTAETGARKPTTADVDTPGVADAEGGAVPLDQTLPLAVESRPVPEGAPLDHPAYYFNRELSWIDFNWRVFYQALDPRTPLIERVRFIAITANNLDEFYRKRIGGLKRQLGAGVRALSPDGRTPREQLDLSSGAALTMQRRTSGLWEDEIRPALADAGLAIRDYDDLDAEAQARLDDHFQRHLYPILTPLAVDSGHPFPFISNLSLSLAFTLRHPGRGTEHFARLKIPTGRGRWVPVGDGSLDVVAVEDLIRHNAESLFRGMNVVGVHAFRVTRNASVERSEEEADDLLAMISEELRERRFSEVVRVEVEASMPRRVRSLITRELDLDEAQDLIEVEGLLDLAGLMALGDADLPHLKDLPWEPVVPVRLRHQGLEDEDDMFAAIRSGDLLVHHPYESFAASVQRFVEEAAEDPKVLAIKMTLYRTSQDSPIVRALIRAAEAGKQVAALVELKARFDEANNIEWAQRLERAGAHVTYGLVGLKTHAKTTLVVREEGDRLRTYAHLGTGNYNPTTARFYTDFGLFTCRDEIGDDLVGLFHFLTGYAPEQEYTTLVVAPRDLRARFVELIRREASHARAGRRGRIVAKMNALDDVGIIRELYKASRAGVEIDLIVRGHTRMRPGLVGASENVRIVSLVGRFLEHSRIYYFHNDGGHPDVLIGSADWMRRNLDDRVEVVVPVEDETARGRLLRTLQFCLDDNRQAWDLAPDGRYTLRQPDAGEPVRAFHDTLMQRARRRVEEDAAWTF
ncbi:polyphosphate kinase 1 [Rubrivirga sp. S365]|uniref:polyphosphate kinase 1 n=1 Tax=Rubrivirga sp. S365 TaxID=3076080 RepID=UPI0028C7B6D1|nr:polyphosphate kinase 1 [Rubrivirga sp. S365]MDT7856938.1 polyphosphate kinase 1 [Rubrivirga sp. S365]